MFLLQSTHLLWVFYSQSTSNVKFWNFSPLIYYVRSTCNFYPSIFYGFLTSIAGIVKMAAYGNAHTMFMLSLIWFLSSVKKSTLRKLEAFAKKNSLRVQPAHLSFSIYSEVGRKCVSILELLHSKLFIWPLKCL